MWSLKFSENFHIPSLVVSHSHPVRQAEQIQWRPCFSGGTLRPREAKDPGVPWIMAEPDLDFCPLPPGLRAFTLDMSTTKQKHSPTLFVAMILGLNPRQTPFWWRKPECIHSTSDCLECLLWATLWARHWGFNSEYDVVSTSKQLPALA